MFSQTRPRFSTLNQQSAAPYAHADTTIQSWQLEDALNALMAAQNQVAKIEHQHARETEELHLIIAAHEHSSQKYQQESERAKKELKRIQAETNQRLDAAKKYVSENQATIKQQREKQQAERDKLTNAFRKRDEKLQKQAQLIADLTAMCDKRDLELEESQCAIEKLHRQEKSVRSQHKRELEELKSEIATYADQLQSAEQALDSLQAEGVQKENDLTEALRLCDEFEAKLIRSSEDYSRDRGDLEESLTMLRGQTQEQEAKMRQLEEERKRIEEEYSVRLDNLTEESQKQSAEAENKYQNQIGNLQSTIDDLEAKAKKRAEEVEQLSSKIVDLNSDYAEKFAAAQKRIQDEVTRASKGHQEELNQLQSVIGSLEGKIQTNTTIASKSQQEAEELRQQCEKLKKQTAEQEKNRAAKVSSLAETIRRSQEKVKEQKLEEYKELKVRVKDLEQKLKETRVDGLRFKREARRLASRLSKHLADHAKQRDHFCDRIEALQQQLESQRSSRRAA